VSGRALVNGQDLQHVEETDGRDWTDLDLPLIQRSGLVGVGDQADRDFRRVQRLDARAAVVQEPIRDDFLAARNRRRALRAAVLEAQHARVARVPGQDAAESGGFNLGVNRERRVSDQRHHRPVQAQVRDSSNERIVAEREVTDRDAVARPLSTSTVRCHSDAGPR